MPRTSILALAGVALVLAGCGSSSTKRQFRRRLGAAGLHEHGFAGLYDEHRRVPRPLEDRLDGRLDGSGERRCQPIWDRASCRASVGKLQAGQMLISNFNAKEGAARAPVRRSCRCRPPGRSRRSRGSTPKALPGPCPGGVGLTTALNVLPGGYVVVGSLPTTNGKTATAKYGCLIVLDSEGKAVETIASKNIQGPWDSTAKSEGPKTTLFVSNALNGGAAKGIHTIDNSTVLRIELESGEHQTPKVSAKR